MCVRPVNSICNQVNNSQVLIDGKLHHEGTNIISLWKSEGGWIVTGVADNMHLPVDDNADEQRNE